MVPPPEESGLPPLEPGAPSPPPANALPGPPEPGFVGEFAPPSPYPLVELSDVAAFAPVSPSPPSLWITQLLDTPTSP